LPSDAGGAILWQDDRIVLDPPIRVAARAAAREPTDFMVSSRVAGVRRLNSLLQQASEPLFLLDRQRRLVFVNRAWEELTGHPAEDVLGWECVPPGPSAEGSLADVAGSFSPPPEALAGRPASGLARVVHAGGEACWRRIEFAPLCDPEGSPIAFLGCIREADVAVTEPDSGTLRLRAELGLLRERLRERYGFDSLIGRGAAHRRFLDQLAAAAATSVPVLVLGEPGTGRRLAARTIHQRSDRAQEPLRMYDCAALPPEVLERELFRRGIERPDAASAAARNGGSLLLTDIVDLPRDLQARLAGILEGPTRLIATSAVDPEQARREDRLRPEIYFALTTLVVRLAPLRERLEDLPLLAQHFLERANARGERRRSSFDSEAMEALAAYDWPGNLRELARVVDAAHGQATGEVIRATDLPAAIRGAIGAAYNPPPMPTPATPLDETLTQVERRLIEQALQRARQNKSRAAELLAISRPRLYRRIKELNIPDLAEPPDGDGSAGPIRGAVETSP
jgi:PAS domain S-box-containing protein